MPVVGIWGIDSIVEEIADVARTKPCTCGGISGLSGPRIMAVIHYLDDGNAMDNAAIARDCGCAGVFLIEMNGRDIAIEKAAVEIKAHFPNFLVGANRLASMPWEAIARDSELGLDATWVDNPGADSKGPGPYAERINEALETARKKRPLLFFGSVAFKTQSHDPDHAMAAFVAASQGWIPTTSGRATGIPPEASKLADMKGAIGGARLAVASGIDPDNVIELGPYVDWILVSTGVSGSFHSFDPAKLRLLVERASSLTPSDAAGDRP